MMRVFFRFHVKRDMYWFYHDEFFFMSVYKISIRKKTLIYTNVKLLESHSLISQ